MKFYTENEALDKVIGAKETQARKEYDAQMQEMLNMLEEIEKDDLYIPDYLVRKMFA